MLLRGKGIVYTEEETETNDILLTSQRVLQMNKLCEATTMAVQERDAVTSVLWQEGSCVLHVRVLSTVFMASCSPVS